MTQVPARKIVLKDKTGHYCVPVIDPNDKSQGSLRSVGEVIESDVPLSDPMLHLKDGTLLTYTSIYRDYISFMESFVETSTDRYSNVYLTSGIVDNNGVLSGFSYTDKVIISRKVQDVNALEFIVKFHTDSDVSTTQALLGEVGFDNYQNVIGISSGKFYITCSSNHTSYDLVGTGTYNILTDTDYWMKFRVSTNSLLVSYSLDGTTYTNDCSVNFSTNPFAVQTPWNLGRTGWAGTTNPEYAQPFSGTIDLNGCQILENNVVVWNGRPVDGTCTEAEWQYDVTTYGCCGKYVVDSINHTVRLPKTSVFQGRHLIKSYRNGTEWYNLFSDGWCEQGGYINSPVYHAVYTVQLQQSYRDTNYMPVITRVGAYDSYAWGTHTNFILSIDTTNFSVGTSSEGGGLGQIKWKAEGYTNLDPTVTHKKYEYICLASKINVEAVGIAIDQLEDQISTFESSVNSSISSLSTNKSNIGMDNLNRTGKEKIASLANIDPSSIISITLGTSGSSYTAPADGYFRFSGGSTIQIAGLATSSGSNNLGANVLIPVKKNQQITVHYVASGDAVHAYFYYLNGHTA